MQQLPDQWVNPLPKKFILVFSSISLASQFEGGYLIELQLTLEIELRTCVCVWLISAHYPKGPYYRVLHSSQRKHHGVNLMGHCDCVGVTTSSLHLTLNTAVVMCLDRFSSFNGLVTAVSAFSEIFNR